ncbi:FxSxx-COOH system tetratricopeptide repeat protein [Streptomyces sp. NRRL F-5123]|uniref:FxSxx-COOH system tetratricopeptide repeat protein n=1 Tax=Streptomyces sp. NRRL F-5123 TaxID=1463856 RepID=UPI001F26F622|nr:FxSxx-COOH system tetratricopeptide repeat protein [Streptomyces sp. NRRL F-5123]
MPSRAMSFQVRAEAGRLAAAMDGGGTAVLCQVLTGMGGVGKTQLAADFAHRSWDERRVEVLVWVTAVSRTAIVAAYAQAGEELCGADPGHPERAATVFLAWLRVQDHRWLVVLDDIADPADVKGLWPPDSPTGRTLATTRNRGAALTGQGRRRIDVGLFSPAEATAYLAGVLAAHGRTAPADQLAGLADDLGHLPLALSQAAAYLVDQALPVTDYRARLADHARTLDHALPARGDLPDDQDDPVTAAWSLSLDLADRQGPPGLARRLLQLAAVLDPNGIPAPVLDSGPARAWYATGTGQASEAQDGTDVATAVAVEQVYTALRVLHRLSLVDHSPDTPHHAVRVHALIQRTTADTLTPEQHTACTRAAADALTEAWPDIERDTDLAQALRANTTVLTGHAEPSGCLYRPDAHTVHYRAGRSLGEAGQVIAARDHFHHLIQTTTHHLGPDHPDTLTARHELTYWGGHAGDAAGATTGLAELLKDVVRVLGPDHPETLTTRSNLARWRGEGGDAAGAATALAELLKDVVRVLGPDHPETLTTRHNLAYWRGHAGDAAGATTGFAELLEDMVRVLGPDHPHTLTTRSNLARWRGEAGDAAGATTGLAELLKDVVRVLGPDHPETLTTRSNLARWRGEAGDAAGATTAFAELLKDVVRVLGPDHPETLTTRHNLAYQRGEAGDASGAATALAELLEDRARVLGPGHPHTLITRHELAHWRGRSDEAAGTPD